MTMPAPQASGASSAAASKHARRARAQWLSCLAAAGRVKTLEQLAARHDGTAAAADERYHLAVALAFEGDMPHALDELRRVVACQPDHVEARGLACRLCVYLGRQRAAEKDWDGFSRLMAEAVAMAPAESDAAMGLRQFGELVPILHLRSGNRREAAQYWEGRLKANPADVHLLHNLALLYYWWAMGMEEGASDAADPGELSSAWSGAIAYWSVLARTDSFWRAWVAARERAWGFQIKAEDLDSLRASFLEERFGHFLSTRLDMFKQRKDDARVQQYEELLTATLLERRFCGLWKEAAARLGDDAPGLLRLPAGFLFFRRFGLLGEAKRCAEQIPGTAMSEERLAHLLICCSPTGLSRALVLLEDRKKPEEALRALDSLRSAESKSVPARYLRSLALSRRAVARAAAGMVHEAVGDWVTAHGEARKTRELKACQRPFATLLDSLCDTISVDSAKAVQKEAARLRKADKLDEAVAILESVRPIDKDGETTEYLCIFLCDSAMQLIRGLKHTEARRILDRVLKLKPKFGRAVECLATSYNNEACECDDPDRSTGLFEKAVDLDPNNQPAKRNLAASLKEKAIRTANSLTPYSRASAWDGPIKLLERAAKLAGPQLASDALDRLDLLAMVPGGLDQNMLQRLFQDTVQDELLRNILVNLVIARRMRRQMGGS